MSNYASPSAPSEESAHANPYANLARISPGSCEGLNPFSEEATPGVNSEPWMEDIGLDSTDRGFGRGDQLQPGDAATGSFPSEFAESLSNA